MDYKKNLLQMIEDLIGQKISVKEFEKKYYYYYLDEVPEDALSGDDHVFFGDIQEKLDWVDEKPDEESRKHGWLNHEEYIEWVKNEMKKYK